MSYLGKAPTPVPLSSDDILDGTITNADIASDAAIATSKIDGLANVATTGAYTDITGAPTITAFAETILDDADAATVLATLGLTSTAAEINTLDGYTGAVADLNRLDIATEGLSEASKVVTADSNGVVTFDNGTISEATAITSSSNAATIDLQDGDNFTHTLTENVTYTFSNPASSGKASAFTLKVVQDASASGYTITWPASVDWAAATAPTLTATASAVDYFVFITTDGGTTYYGFTAGQALA